MDGRNEGSGRGNATRVREVSEGRGECGCGAGYGARLHRRVGMWALLLAILDDRPDRRSVEN